MRKKTYRMYNFSAANVVMSGISKMEIGEIYQLRCILNINQSELDYLWSKDAKLTILWDRSKPDNKIFKPLINTIDVDRKIRIPFKKIKQPVGNDPITFSTLAKSIQAHLDKRLDKKVKKKFKRLLDESSESHTDKDDSESTDNFSDYQPARHSRSQSKGSVDDSDQFSDYEPADLHESKSYQRGSEKNLSANLSKYSKTNQEDEKIEGPLEFYFDAAPSIFNHSLFKVGETKEIDCTLEASTKEFEFLKEKEATLKISWDKSLSENKFFKPITDTVDPSQGVKIKFEMVKYAGMSNYLTFRILAKSLIGHLEPKVEAEMAKDTMCNVRRNFMKESIKERKKYIDEVMEYSDSLGSGSLALDETDCEETSDDEDDSDNDSYEYLVLNFEASSDKLSHSKMKVGEICHVQCSLDLSQTEVSFLKRKGAGIKVKWDNSKTFYSYFKPDCEKVEANRTVRMPFKMVKHTGEFDFLTHENLASSVKGYLDPKIDKKMAYHFRRSKKTISKEKDQNEWTSSKRDSHGSNSQHHREEYCLYDFTSAPATFGHSNMRIGHVRHVKCTLKISPHEYKFLEERDAEFKLIYDNSDILHTYFKPSCNFVDIDKTINIPFQMIRHPGNSDFLTFADLAKSVKGRLNSKLDEEIFRKFNRPRRKLPDNKPKHFDVKSPDRISIQSSRASQSDKSEILINSSTDDIASDMSDDETTKKDNEKPFQPFDYKFLSSNKSFYFNGMSIGDILEIRCSFDVSEDELRYLRKKKTRVQLSSDPLYGRSNQYICPKGDYLEVNNVINIPVKLVKKPPQGTSFTFNELARGIIGQIDPKLDAKIARKKKFNVDIIIATFSKTDGPYKISKGQERLIKVRLPQNNRKKNGAKMNIHPIDHDKFEVLDETNTFEYEQSTRRMVSFVKIFCKSTTPVILENGNLFGFA